MIPSFIRGKARGSKRNTWIRTITVPVRLCAPMTHKLFVSIHRRMASKQYEECCDEFVICLDRRISVNYGCCRYLTILYRTLLYNKDLTFVYVPWVIIYVRLDPRSRLILCPILAFKSGYDKSTPNRTRIYRYCSTKSVLGLLTRSGL